MTLTLHYHEGDTIIDDEGHDACESRLRTSKARRANARIFVQAVMTGSPIQARMWQTLVDVQLAMISSETGCTVTLIATYNKNTKNVR